MEILELYRRGSVYVLERVYSPADQKPTDIFGLTKDIEKMRCSEKMIKERN